MMVGGVNADKVIDHVDGNPSNNRIENLREVSQSQNTRNRKSSKGDKTLPTGVQRVVNNAGNVYYQATWTENCSQKCVRFSVTKLGEERAMQLAIDLRAEVDKETWISYTDQDHRKVIERFI